MLRPIALSLVLAFATSHAFAGEELEFDAAMRAIATEYAAIHKAFSEDTTTGVDEATKKIEDTARAIDPSTITGDNADRFKALPEGLASSASALIKATDLAAKRTAFKALSASMVEWASAAKPDGIHIAFCPMAKARWLQSGDEVSNPYYGSSMLRCGTLEDTGSAPAEGGQEGSAGSHSAH